MGKEVLKRTLSSIYYVTFPENKNWFKAVYFMDDSEFINYF